MRVGIINDFEDLTKVEKPAFIPLPHKVVHPLYLTRKDIEKLNLLELDLNEVRARIVKWYYSYKQGKKLSRSKELYARFFEKYPWTLEIDKVYVIPAKFRPTMVSYSDKINRFYRQLLKKCKSQFATDNVIQKAVNKLFDFIIEEVLQGKKKLIRGDLLGRRIDFSARTVITVDPNLPLYKVKIPYRILVHLYMPWILNLAEDPVEIYFRIQNYNDNDEELEEFVRRIAKDIPVILNRQPTLHRPSMQAFYAEPIKGYAIQIPPLIVKPYNADFDGDQMAVYIPITKEAIEEVKSKMMSYQNLLFPGSLKFSSSQLGFSVYLATRDPDENDQPIEVTNLRELSKLIDKYGFTKKAIYKGEETTLGRLLFRLLGFKVDRQITGKDFDKLVTEFLYDLYLEKGEIAYRNVAVIDYIFQQLRKIDISINLNDFTQIMEDEEFLKLKQGLKENYQEYLAKCIQYLKQHPEKFPNLATLINSKTKGSWLNLQQLFVAKGYVQSFRGFTIPTPITSSFVEGLNEKEIVLMSFGTIKGSYNRSVSTADTGYLTRRLVYALEDIELDETLEDCGDKEGIQVTLTKDNIDQFLFRWIINEDGTETFLTHLNKHEFLDKTVRIRSPITCKSDKLCKKCYPYYRFYKSRNVGIIAAQSLGEPTTQLMMRVFHTGGASENPEEKINQKYFTIEYPSVIAKEELKLAEPVNLEKYSILETDVVLELENGDTVILPKNSVLLVDIVDTIPKGAVLELRKNITSALDEILCQVEFKPDEEKDWVEVYKTLLQIFNEVGIKSLHIETLLRGMMRNPENPEQYAKSTKHYKLYPIRKVIYLKPIMIAFERFKQNFPVFVLNEKMQLSPLCKVLFGEVIEVTEESKTLHYIYTNKLLVSDLIEDEG